MFIILLLVAGALVFTIWLTNWVLSKADGPQAMRDVAREEAKLQGMRQKAEAATANPKAKPKTKAKAKEEWGKDGKEEILKSLKVFGGIQMLSFLDFVL